MILSNYQPLQPAPCSRWLYLLLVRASNKIPWKLDREHPTRTPCRIAPPIRQQCRRVFKSRNLLQFSKFFPFDSTMLPIVNDRNCCIRNVRIENVLFEIPVDLRWNAWVWIGVLHPGDFRALSRLWTSESSLQILKCGWAIEKWKMFNCTRCKLSSVRFYFRL